MGLESCIVQAAGYVIQCKEIRSSGTRPKKLGHWDKPQRHSTVRLSRQKKKKRQKTKFRRMEELSMVVLGTKRQIQTLNKQRLRNTGTRDEKAEEKRKGEITGEIRSTRVRRKEKEQPHQNDFKRKSEEKTPFHSTLHQTQGEDGFEMPRRTEFYDKETSIMSAMKIILFSNEQKQRGQIFVDETTQVTINKKGQEDNDTLSNACERKKERKRVPCKTQNTQSHP